MNTTTINLTFTEDEMISFLKQNGYSDHEITSVDTEVEYGPYGKQSFIKTDILVGTKPLSGVFVELFKHKILKI